MFWDNFKEICDKKRLKPTPVLKECNISTGSIGRWQAGSSPNADAVITLAKYFHCSTDLLLIGEEYVKPGEPRPLSPDENELLTMFRTIPDSAKEYFWDSLKAAYDKEIRRREAEERLLG